MVGAQVEGNAGGWGTILREYGEWGHWQSVLAALRVRIVESEGSWDIIGRECG